MPVGENSIRRSGRVIQIRKLVRCGENYQKSTRRWDVQIWHRPKLCRRDKTFLSSWQNLDLFDRPAVYDDAARIGTFAGFASRPEAVRAGKPDDIAFACGHFVGQFVEETASCFGAWITTDWRVGGTCGEADQNNFGAEKHCCSLYHSHR